MRPLPSSKKRHLALLKAAFDLVFFLLSEVLTQIALGKLGSGKLCASGLGLT
jgi:hypothetical protein